MAPTTDTDSKIDTKGISDSRKGARRSEPSFEMLSNFSRVTPMQLPYIAFNTDGRYHPVRPVYPHNNKHVKDKTSTVKQNAPGALTDQIPEYDAVGGGILMLIDQHPEQPSDFIDLEPPKPLAAAEANTNEVEPVTSSDQTSRPHISLDPAAPEVDPPASFEVSQFISVHKVTVTDDLFVL